MKRIFLAIVAVCCAFACVLVGCSGGGGAHKADAESLKGFWALEDESLGFTGMLNLEDEDFAEMLIHHGGRDYPIYREALPAFRNCVRLTEFRYKHPNYPDRTVWKDRIPGDILVRGIRSVPSMAVMQVELSRRLRRANEAGKTEMRLSYYRIWISGVFYRMYEDELAGFPADFSSVVDEKLGDFQYKLPDKGNTQEYKRKKVAESYLSDYERWKQTLTV